MTARLLRLEDRDLRRTLTATLRSGGVVIMPCDTIYGIVGIGGSEQRIRGAKGRGETKPFIRLIPELGWLPRLTRSRPPSGILGLWPGPLTLILPALAGGTVAVRLPDDELLRSTMGELGEPLLSTSVNRSGEPALGAVTDIRLGFGSFVDLIVDAGDREAGLPSTILDLTVFPYRVLRQGGLRVPESLLSEPPEE